MKRVVPLIILLFFFLIGIPPSGSASVREDLSGKPIFTEISSMGKVTGQVVEVAENASRVQVIITLNGGQEMAVKQLRNLDAKIKRRYKLINAVAVTLPSETLPQVASVSGVGRVVLDRRMHVPLPENSFRPQLGVSGSSINADNVHDLGVMGKNVEIAAVDTGIYWPHPSLENKLVENVSFVERTSGVGTDNDPMDYFGHGTHVAGIAAGREENVIQKVKGGTRTVIDENFAPSNSYTKLRIKMYNGVPNGTIYYEYSFLMENSGGGHYLENGRSKRTQEGHLENVIQFDSDGVVDNFENARITVHTTGSSLYVGLEGWDNSRSIWDNLYGERTTVGPGIAPKARLWNVKVLNSEGRGFLSWVMDGIEYAALGPDENAGTGDEADVINLSLGAFVFPNTGNDPLSRIVDNAVEQGVTVVVAAGNNSGFQTIETPASARRPISVGALDDNGTPDTADDDVAFFSSRGPSAWGRLDPDLSAPGVEITSSAPWGSETASGTSMAAPHVAGGAALLIERHPGWAPGDIKRALMNAASPVPSPPYPLAYPFEEGAGRINVLRALVENLRLSMSGEPAWAAEVKPGSSVSSTLKVKNLSADNLRVTISSTDLYGHLAKRSIPGNNIVLGVSAPTIPAKGSKSVPVTVNVPENSDPSYYSGLLVASSDNQVARLPIAVTVPALLERESPWENSTSISGRSCKASSEFLTFDFETDEDQWFLMASESHDRDDDLSPFLVSPENVVVEFGQSPGGGLETPLPAPGDWHFGVYGVHSPPLTTSSTSFDAELSELSEPETLPEVEELKSRMENLESRIATLEERLTELLDQSSPPKRFSPSARVDDDWVDRSKVPESLVYGENAFCSIGEAISAADSGDEIGVMPGTYDSNVENFPILVDKENVAVRSVEGPENTVIAGPRLTTIFSIKAPHAVVDGFKIMHGGKGIAIHSNNATVGNNVIIWKGGRGTWLASGGIWLFGSSHARIENNRLENCGIFILGRVVSSPHVEGSTLTGMWMVGENVSYFDSHVMKNNTVNGKPIFYYNNETGVTVPPDAGEVILANCSDVRIENIDTSNVSVGVEVAHSENILVSNCRCLNNSLFGIYLAYSHDSIIVNNTLDNNNHGIDLRNSNNNEVENNSVRSNEQGIFLSFSDNNEMAKNLVSSNGNGIFFASSMNNAVENNVVSSNWSGIRFLSSDNNVVENNLFNSNRDSGIRLSSSTNNALINNLISSGGTGIFLNSSEKNTIENNVITSNRFSGIYLGGSSNNRIDRNSIEKNSNGIRIVKDTENNSIHYNRVMGNTVGIRNETDQTTDARYNYWGTTSYNQVSMMMRGPVKHRPICDGEMNPVRYSWFIDRDDRVGLSDLMIVVHHYGETGTPGWIPADVDGNGSIGLQDLMTVVHHYGEEWTE